MKLLIAAAVITLIAHVLLAAIALKYLPQGFPVDHLRFWLNTVFPAVLLVFSGITLALPRARGFAVFTLGAFWTALSFVAIPLYPSSAIKFAPATLVLGIVLLLIARWLVRARRSSYANDRQNRPSRAAVMGPVMGALVGALVIFHQRALPPATRPLGGELHEVPPGFDVVDRRDFDPDTAIHRIRCGAAMLEVSPLLTFHSRSPDRFATNFAPPESFGANRRVIASDYSEDTIRYRWLDDGETTLAIEERPTGVRLDARSKLRAPVYSHLNQYASLVVRGVDRLELRFSSTGAESFEVLPSDYPEGRPLRFASFDGTKLRVVEASSGEKGPFKLLAEGELARGQPLVLTLLSEGRELCAITLEDFSAQASVDLSPTAGWGVAQNSIQFSRAGNRVHFISMSLASTGPGRGFESVGHSAGVYRNGMIIE